jgi:hypothetical protein
MFGYILLAIAIVTYIIELRRISLFIFVTFMLNGWSVLTDTVLGVKNYDLAFIYTIVVLSLQIFYEDSPDLKDWKLRLLIFIFFIFMLLNVNFSFVHYHFTSLQILQGSRASFLIMSYFFLRKYSKNDFLWLNTLFFYITLITSILFILQVFFDLPVLPYDTENIKRDNYTGILRYYNHPPLLYWYIFVSILTPHLIKSRLTFLSSFVFITALVATQGRTQIGTTIGVLLLGVIMQNRIKSIIGSILIGLFVISQFADIIGARFEGQFNDSTENDIESILSGGIQETVKAGSAYNVGTLTYRLAWFYERALYMHDQPLGEKLFGLGLISDSQLETVEKMYDFSLGLRDADGNVMQLSTPDISYGNILTKYGYMGGIIYLSLWVYLLLFFYKRKREDDYSFVGFLLIFNTILIAFAGCAISNQGNVIFPFLLYISILHGEKDERVSHSTQITDHGQNKESVA